MVDLARPSAAVTAPATRFGALQERDFRQLWLSSIALGSGQQMEVVALGWYVLQRTNSPVLVGLIGAVRMWGMFLAPFGGVLADRVSRRTLLLTVQAVLLLVAVCVLLLALMDALSTPALFAAMVAAGLARAFDNTARQTLVGDLVPRERLTNAVALVQAAMNGSQILAPVVAGVLFGIAGIAGCFAVICALYLWAVLSTSAIRPVPVVAGNTAQSPLRTMIEGARYVRDSRVVAALLWLAAIANLCGFPLTFSMMPSFARDELGVGSAGLGALLSAVGVGSLLGSLVLSGLGDIGGRGRAVLVGMLGWMAVIAVFALTPWFPLALVLLALFGVCQSVSLSLIGALLLGITPPPLRGRVMGVRMFAVAPLPAGSLLGGWLIAATGAPITAVIFAVSGALLTLLVALRIPGILRQQ